MILDFEKPLLELENRIAELKQYAGEKGIDLAAEINLLENRLRELKKEIYENLTPWQRTQLARHPERPNALDYFKLLFTDFLPLCGDRCYGDDPALVGGIARFEGVPVTVIGHMKGHNTKENLARNFGMPSPEGFRKALRLAQQAEKFGRPVISLIDTPGAYSGAGAEERGQAWAIANNLFAFSRLKTPIIVIITGEGGSGGALALGVGDVLLMLENSIFSVISPEGCAAILWKDAQRAPEAARVLKLTASELLSLGLIDGVIPEPLGGAHRDPEGTADNIRAEIRQRLQELRRIDTEQLVAARWSRLRRIGCF
ncbi:MAG TPA: acetyl-CoA carboxylase carboxyltransferase subunit alpha [Syntrophomonadaceae bacterium]|nr:acetyl-CoA carboxylase carboxyltransferase subunit alpha [Syntrophomonadaceae bacterium]